MATEAEPYGAQLCAECAKLNRLDHITRRLDYAAIQRLKQADRQRTIDLFRGSHYDFLQLLKTKEPAEAAHYLIEKEQAAAGSAAIMFGTVVF